MTIDPNIERKRLSELYSGMTPEELEKLAEVVSTLTDVAQEALQAELSRRGIKVESREPVQPEPNRQNIVPLRVFRDLPRALLAKSILDSANIPCFLSDENTIRMDWFLSNALGGIKLLVREEDGAAATELLDQQWKEPESIRQINERHPPTS